MTHVIVFVATKVDLLITASLFDQVLEANFQSDVTFATRKELDYLASRSLC